MQVPFTGRKAIQIDITMAKIDGHGQKKTTNPTQEEKARAGASKERAFLAQQAP